MHRTTMPVRSVSTMQLVAACACVLALVYGYNDVDNTYNYEVVARNATELKHHLNCFMNKEPCNDIAAHYKSHILDTLINDCKLCTDQHRHNAKWFIRGAKEKYPDDYEEFKKMYDPDNKLFPIFEADVDKY